MFLLRCYGIVMKSNYEMNIKNENVTSVSIIDLGHIWEEVSMPPTSFYLKVHHELDGKVIINTSCEEWFMFYD